MLLAAARRGHGAARIVSGRNIGLTKTAPSSGQDASQHVIWSRPLSSSSDAGPSYKDGLNLPKTEFPMRADAANREPALQEYSMESLYRWQAESNPGPRFVLHDGPPYANGPLHMGHLLNKVLKDIINRHQVLRGRRVHYVPGWDCHGLPIELKALEGIKGSERSSLEPLKLRKMARQLAEGAVSSQMEGFRRWGVMADWDEAYTTMQPEYEAAQLRVFCRMVEDGRVYRGLRPVYWSPSSRTALAEAELEYPEDHKSKSCWVAFPLHPSADVAPGVASALGVPGGEGLCAVTWTTTPWTLPANVALCFNPALRYVAVRAPGHGSRALLVAEGRVPALAEALGADPSEMSVLGGVYGSELEGLSFMPPLASPGGGGVSVALMGEHVTDGSGTGVVHTAPGHGQDDFAACRSAGIAEVPMPVDGAGKFTAEADERAPAAGGGLAGLPVLGAGNDAVLQALEAAGLLLKAEDHAHRYPYDWRTKKPVITRATTQWFARLGESDQAAARAAVAGVTFLPAAGRARLEGMLGSRREWCISRQRSWGVPIPAFYDQETGEALLTGETIEHVAGLVAARGSDCWWELPVEDLLPPALRHESSRWTKGTDTMDVWFDSGSSWAAVVRRVLGGEALPVDVYLEGSDQHRGWFQSSLQTSVAVTGAAPYRRVVTHGFVLDEKKHKMSKSLGNVVDPMELIMGPKGGSSSPKGGKGGGEGGGKGGKRGRKDKGGGALGADVLRLWAASTDFTRDVLVGQTVLGKTADAMRRLRNTSRYLLGNLYDFDPAQHAVHPAELPSLERYLLHRAAAFCGATQHAYDDLRLSSAVAEALAFTSGDISALYAESMKDVLYCDPAGSPRRRAAQTALWHSLQSLLYALAPVAPHMAEDMYRHLPPACLSALSAPPPPSAFQTGWLQRMSPGGGDPAGGWAAWEDAGHGAEWESLLALRGGVNRVLEGARGAGDLAAFLEARVALTLPPGSHGLAATLRTAMRAPPGQQGGGSPSSGGDEYLVPGLEDLFVVSEVEGQALCGRCQSAV